MRVPRGSGRERKRCDWKRTYGRDALQPPLQEPASVQAPLTAGIRFRDERKMESSPQLQHRSETPSVRRRHVWGFVGSLSTWGDPLAVIRMNRSVHRVWSAAQVRGPHLKVFCFTDLWRGFVLRQDLSSNLPPLPVPSLYEKHTIIIHPIILHPAFIHSSYETSILFIPSPLCSPPPQRWNSLAEGSIKNTVTSFEIWIAA